MAQGDVVLFNQFLEDVGLKIHQLETDVLKLALVTNATVPADTTPDPAWGAGGTTNFKTTEVTPGGNYVADGIDVAATYSETTGTATLDGATNPSWAQHASNPTDATWGILFNETSTNNKCIAYVDLGGAFNMTTGDLTVTWAGGGIATMT